jgi:hypothetical protein
VLGLGRGLGVEPDRGRQLGDHRGGARRVGDQFALDLQRLEDPLRLCLGRVGQAPLDLGSHLLEQVAVGLRQPLQPAPDQLGTAPAPAHTGLGSGRDRGRQLGACAHG